MLKIKIGQLLLYVFLSSLLYDVAFSATYEAFKNVRQYDLFFHKNSKEYFGPNFDWMLFKAQAIAESRLNETARSRVGAQGIMQIMPGTFSDIKRKELFEKGSILDPKINIRAGIWYDREMWSMWSHKESFDDRINFMFGSYNAGAGNLIKAQEYCNKNPNSYGNPHSWYCIDKTLHFVTGELSSETKGYVKNIDIIHEILRRD